MSCGRKLRGEVRLDDGKRTLRRSDDPQIAVSRLLRQAPSSDLIVREAELEHHPSESRIKALI